MHSQQSQLFFFSLIAGSTLVLINVLFTSRRRIFEAPASIAAATTVAAAAFFAASSAPPAGGEDTGFRPAEGLHTNIHPLVTAAFLACAVAYTALLVFVTRIPSPARWTIIAVLGSLAFMFAITASNTRDSLLVTGADKSLLSLKVAAALTLTTIIFLQPRRSMLTYSVNLVALVLLLLLQFGSDAPSLVVPIAVAAPLILLLKYWGGNIGSLNALSVPVGVLLNMFLFMHALSALSDPDTNMTTPWLIAASGFLMVHLILPGNGRNPWVFKAAPLLSFLLSTLVFSNNKIDAIPANVRAVACFVLGLVVAATTIPMLNAPTNTLDSNRNSGLRRNAFVATAIVIVAIATCIQYALGASARGSRDGPLLEVAPVFSATSAALIAGQHSIGIAMYAPLLLLFVLPPYSRLLYDATGARRGPGAPGAAEEPGAAGAPGAPEEPGASGAPPAGQGACARSYCIDPPKATDLLSASDESTRKRRCYEHKMSYEAAKRAVSAGTATPGQKYCEFSHRSSDCFEECGFASEKEEAYKPVTSDSIRRVRDRLSGIDDSLLALSDDEFVRLKRGELDDDGAARDLRLIRRG